MEISLQIAQALAAGGVGSGLFWLCWGWLSWRAWLAVALPYALMAYLVLFGLVKAG